MIRVFEAFAGYGSQSMGLERLKQDYPQFDYEVVGISEIDKYAVKAYNATHEPTANYGDICLIDWDSVPDFDLFTYSFPCQDISSAGRQRGLEAGSGTRSSLLWECRKAIETKRPKYLLMENVKALVNKKFINHFNDWLLYLESLGYSNFWQVLNAKDYGVPQNRERVFVVSILGNNEQYKFPNTFELIKRLSDVLEECVDEKYYLSEKFYNCILSHTNRKIQEGCGFKPQFITSNEAPGTITTKYGQRSTDPYIIQNGRGYVETKEFELCPTITSHGFERNNFAFVSYTRDKKGNVVDRHLKDVSNTVHTSTGSGGNTDCFVFETKIKQLCNILKEGNYSNPKRGRVYCVDGISPTLDTMAGGRREQKILSKYNRIRKLTPRECFRLMGVSETDIDKIQSAGISNRQQYKMAGNSIVVDVLYFIFKNLFFERPKIFQLKLFK